MLCVQFVSTLGKESMDIARAVVLVQVKSSQEQDLGLRLCYLGCETEVCFQVNIHLSWYSKYVLGGSVFYTATYGIWRYNIFGPWSLKYHKSKGVYKLHNLNECITCVRAHSNWTKCQNPADLLRVISLKDFNSSDSTSVRKRGLCWNRFFKWHGRIWVHDIHINWVLEA